MAECDLQPSVFEDRLVTARKAHVCLELVRALPHTKRQTRRPINRASSLVDGTPAQAWRWHDGSRGLNLEAAWIDAGPSPAGNEGPYLKVPTYDGETVHRVCPRRQVGDLLWVRETWCPVDDSDFYAGNKPLKWIDYRATPRYEASHPAGWHNEPDHPDALKWRPSIHLPRWASRWTLRITDIRPERLQDITEEDAKAEGTRDFFEVYPGSSREQRLTCGSLCADAPHRAHFACIWDRCFQDPDLWWRSNPWVWRVCFEPVGGAA